MIPAETGVNIRELNYAAISELLQSSRDAVRAYGIPIEDAVWSSGTHRLTYRMMTSPLHQGHKGICFGGFVDVALHTATGVAAAIRAEQSWSKPVLAQGFFVLYRRPVPVSHEIVVDAIAYEVPTVRRRHYLSLGRIFDADNQGKVLDTGLMWLTVVPRVRRPLDVQGECTG